MAGFTMDGFDGSGAKRWDLRGTGAVAEGDVVTVQHPDGVGYQQAKTPAHGAAATWRDQASTTYLTASLAHINQVNHRIWLEHDVAAHTSDGLWLFSPSAYWLSDENQLVTDEPVRLESEHMLLRGRGAVAQTQLQQAVIHRDVELILNPTEDEQPGQQVQHVQITCDGPLTFDYETSIATFEDNVHIVDVQGDLYSDKLVAYVDQQTHTIKYAEATGHVRIVQGGRTAQSERAVYEPGRHKITLLGSPSLLVLPDGTTRPGAPLMMPLGLPSMPMASMPPVTPKSPRVAASSEPPSAP